MNNGDKQKKQKVSLGYLIWLVRITINSLWKDKVFRFIIISIFFLLLSAPFSMIEYKDINTTGFYYFSSMAQTMGALVAITFTAIITIISLIKSTGRLLIKILSECLKRRSYKSTDFKLSITFCFLEIISAVIGLVLSGQDNMSKLLFIIPGWMALSFGIIGIYFLLHFITKQMSLLISPIDLLMKEAFESEFPNNQKRLNPFVAVDYEIIRVVLEALGIGNEKTKDTLIKHYIGYHREYDYIGGVHQFYQTIINDLMTVEFSSKEESCKFYKGLFYTLHYQTYHLTYDKISGEPKNVPYPIFKPEDDKNIFMFILNNIGYDDFVDELLIIYNNKIGYSFAQSTINMTGFPTSIEPDFEPSLDFLYSWVFFTVNLINDNPKYRILSNTVFFYRIKQVLSKYKSSDLNKDDQSRFTQIIEYTFHFYWLSALFRIEYILHGKYDSSDEKIREKKLLQHDLSMIKEIKKHLDSSSLEKLLKYNIITHNSRERTEFLIRFLLEMPISKNYKEGNIDISAIFKFVNDREQHGTPNDDPTQVFVKKIMNSIIRLKDKTEAIDLFKFGYYFPLKSICSLIQTDTGASNVGWSEQLHVARKIESFLSSFNRECKFAIAGFWVARWQQKDW